MKRWKKFILYIMYTDFFEFVTVKFNVFKFLSVLYIQITYVLKQNICCVAIYTNMAMCKIDM